MPVGAACGLSASLVGPKSVGPTPLPTDLSQSRTQRRRDHPLCAVLRQVGPGSCPGRFNFHCHTHCSDGSLHPEELAHQALAMGLEQIAITEDDVDWLRGSRSRLKPGTVLTRDEMLRLALMASENRAASALGRAYPGGRESFIAAMNQKAQMLGMVGRHDVRDVVFGNSRDSNGGRGNGGNRNSFAGYCLEHDALDGRFRR